MPAIRPPPLSPARPRQAARGAADGPLRRWCAAAAEFVFTICRTGLLQSLIVHVVGLLLLALLVIRPDLPRARAVILEFMAAGAEPKPEVAALEMPASRGSPEDTKG